MSDVTTPSGNVKQIEHWDGTMDATVRPKSYGLKLHHVSGAPANKDYIAAIAEYQTAVRMNERAQLVADPHWIRKAEARLRAAQERLQELQ